MAFRHLKPGVAHLVSGDLIQHPDLLRWMPAATPAARIWLLLLDFAYRRGGTDFASWVARHVPQIPGHLDQVGAVIADLLDWVHANARSSGRQLITRPFTPAMGLKAATQASHDWHEAVANSEDSSDGQPLPPPWYPAATIGAFTIEPITTAGDLVREGYEMHHCAGGYADRVREGGTYVYSVRQDGKRVATVSLVHNRYEAIIRTQVRVSIEQVRGPCNTEPSKAVIACVRQWLRAQP
jgi:hypothetical protein